MPLVIQRVEEQLERLRHQADHNRYEMEQLLVRTKERTDLGVGKADAVQWYADFVEQQRQDVALYDLLLAKLRTIPDAPPPSTITLRFHDGTGIRTRPGSNILIRDAGTSKPTLAFIKDTFFTASHPGAASAADIEQVPLRAVKQIEP
jgi:hypothetical protein